MEVIFQDRYEQMTTEIYVRSKSFNRTVMLTYDGDNLIEQILSDEPIPHEIKPLLKIPISMKTALINAFISEGSKMNLRTENENHLKGKLDATMEHLSDMREFSKKLLDSKLEEKPH